MGKLKGKLLLIFSAVGGIIYLFGFVFYNVAADVSRLIGGGVHSGISVGVIISH